LSCCPGRTEHLQGQCTPHTRWSGRCCVLTRARAGSAWQRALARLPFTAAARALRLRSELAELWARQQSDDLLLIFLSLIDAYVTKARSPAARERPQLPARRARAHPVTSWHARRAEHEADRPACGACGAHARCSICFQCVQGVCMLLSVHLMFCFFFFHTQRERFARPGCPPAPRSCRRPSLTRSRRYSKKRVRAPEMRRWQRWTACARPGWARSRAWRGTAGPRSPPAWPTRAAARAWTACRRARQPTRSAPWARSRHVVVGLGLASGLTAGVLPSDQVCALAARDMQLWGWGLGQG
jgi:hypothetical protein